jgi:Tol biopolymer transport system component
VRRIVVIVAVAACGYAPTRLGPGGDDAPADGVEIDGPETTTDAPPFVGPPPTACVQSWLAGTMQLTSPAFVAGAGILTIGNERDPFVSSDGRVLYYIRQNGGGNDEVVFAKRDQASGPFNNLTVKSSLSDDQVDDSKVTLTDDDLVAFQSTRRTGGTGGYDLWQASRAQGFDVVFGAMTQNMLGALNDAGDQHDPHVSPDGLRLYFVVGSPQHIVVSSRNNMLTNFPAATPIANIGDPAGDADPTLTRDERVLIFSSRRTGAGLSDLWYATRAERDRPFSTPIALSINTAFDDGDPHISPDGCTLYFASKRQGSGDYDLFFSTVQ